MERRGNLKVKVIGAGVIGLSTALRIQQILPHAKVTVLADKFGLETTSDGAAGIYRPTLSLMKGNDLNKVKRWCKDSWNRYDQLARSKEAREAGLSTISGYHFYDEEYAKNYDFFYKDIVYQFRQCTPKEMSMFGNSQPCGVAYTTNLIECRWYLPFLAKQFTANGGKIVKRRLSSLSEVADDSDIIVNCSGFGSRDLIGDKTMVPIRGQMIRAKAPWIKNFVFSGHTSWVIPGRETVIVGGTRQVNDTDFTIRAEDTDSLWENGVKLVPSLAGGQKEWVWVGFRPHRSPIRLERDTYKHGNKQIPLIHNYGHGGNGVSLSWGCAIEAAELVANCVTESKL
ncbi:DgyrCDS7285 [Dimorphilus gyrociliatus]|uniref:DgyrCDS7285 n=1 Tax=Dimorphilus gyrociliatus TaxID=2664684 RepID=A0A7I8VSA0_9ANNE|nr:DgyrCDS7285 [Dimorphilus gyrociliatus]